MRMPALGVRQRQPADKPRQFAILPRPNHQVPVVGHQAIGQQPSLRAFHGLGQDPLERLVVCVVIEDAHPRIGPIEHVVNVAALSSAMRSSHASIVSDLGDPEKVPDTFSAFRKRDDRRSTTTG